MIGYGSIQLYQNYQEAIEDDECNKLRLMYYNINTNGTWKIDMIPSMGTTSLQYIMEMGLDEEHLFPTHWNGDKYICDHGVAVKNGSLLKDIYRLMQMYNFGIVVLVELIKYYLLEPYAFNKVQNLISASFFHWFVISG